MAIRSHEGRCFSEQYHRCCLTIRPSAVAVCSLDVVLIFNFDAETAHPSDPMMSCLTSQSDSL